MESERKAVAVMAAAFFSSGDKVMVAVEPGFRYTVRKVGISEKNIYPLLTRSVGKRKLPGGRSFTAPCGLLWSFY